MSRSTETMMPLQGRRYHFAGVAGSGMAPLALLTVSLGAQVSGSDRNLDRGVDLPIFDDLRRGGVALTPQDGSAIHPGLDSLVHSTAVEPTNPDVIRAGVLGVPLVRRGTFLARLSRARRAVAVAGTSGKSTVTAMVAHILVEAGLEPSFLGGGPAVALRGAVPPGSLRIGTGEWLVVETDESDGSVAEFAPAVAVLTNLSRDHKEVEIVTRWFERLLDQTAERVVSNVGDPGLARVAWPSLIPVVGCAFEDQAAHVTPARVAQGLALTPEGVRFTLDGTVVAIPQPGRLTAENGLIAVVAAEAIGVPLRVAAEAIGRFAGVRRRLERIGAASGVEVFDDFAHNPVKIEAALEALRPTGSLWIYYQPHGYGPTRFFGDALVDTFARSLQAGDRLLLAPIYDAGGTADRSITSEDLIEGLRRRGAPAALAETRQAAMRRIAADAKPGDRVVVMGARDDTLPAFARALLAALVMREAATPVGAEKREP